MTRQEAISKLVALDVAKWGETDHYSVHVSDTRLGSSGHARFLSYEVEGCCRWDARMRALDLHARNFDAWRAT